MIESASRGYKGGLCLGFLCLLLGLIASPPALAAEVPPYEYDPTLSLTGGCSKSDPDPGCPEKKPPQPFTRPTSVAIDSFGYEYVASYGSNGTQGRIDVFSPEGIFITEVKDELGPKNIAVDSKGVLYTFDQKEGINAQFRRFVPTVYKPAEGKIEYGNPPVKVDELPGPSTGGIAIDGDDHVFVDWSFSIKEYKSAEDGNELVDTITSSRLQSSNFVALDQQRRRLYASSCPDGKITECWVIVFDADSYSLLEEVKGPNPPEQVFVSGKGWMSIAVDEESGDFFVGDIELSKNVYQFNKDYEHISTLALDEDLFEGGEALQIAVSNASSAFNYRYLFIPSLKSPNKALAYHPPTEQEPEIESVSTLNIGETEAEPQAVIKPKGGVTEYTFQVITQQAYEEAGNSFSGAPVVGSGSILPAEQEAEVSVAVNGLSPGTAYRFRVFVKNKKGEKEAEGAFATYADAPTASSCPNQTLRIAYSGFLPDCRAYELVTPPDTGGVPPTGLNSAGDTFPSEKTSPSGDAVSFLTRGGSIPGLGGAGVSNGDPYLSTRGADGWSTAFAGEDGTVSTSPNPGGTSPDLRYSFWEATSEGPAVIDGKETRYVRYPDGRLALIGRGSLGEDPRARGRLITEDGGHIIFETRPVNATEEPQQLEPEAAPSGTPALYDRIKNPAAPGGEETKVVSLPPNEEPFKAGEDASFVDASADGEGIAFTVGGNLYLRIDNEETFLVGSGLTYAGISEGGDRIFYMEGGDLKALDTVGGQPGVEIAFTNVGNATPVNVSKDGSRAYFVSTTEIPEAGENPNGAFPVAGQRNLYLSEEGEISFVGTVTARDVDGEPVVSIGQLDGLGLWTTALARRSPSIDPSRLSFDGATLLFQSRANLDGYASGGFPQVYRYDATEDRLSCISCIPTEQPATGGATLISYLLNKDAPPPFNPSGVIANLRADGDRAFFQSTEALVSRDNDEVQDIYEWEAQGVGSCTRSGGCVYLITSGQSARNNYLYAVSDSGDDVFFTTSDVLVGGDNDTLSIYDARVNGGFPEAAEEECIGEGCKPILTPPPLIPPAVTGATGPSGNVSSGGKKNCPKGKRKVKRGGKVVCVKKKQGKKHKGKAGKNKKGGRK